MRRLARISLGMLGLALVAPRGVEAQNAPTPTPSGYYQATQAPAAMTGNYQPAQAPAPAPAAAPRVADGKPMPAKAAAVEAPHKHRGRTLCAKCAAKLQAQNGMPAGTIVGCEHSKNGVCPSCAAALNMPGQFVMAGAAPVEAPGRAVASSSASPAVRGGQPGVPYGDQMGEPAPVGVIQAGFSQAGSAPTGAPAGLAPRGAQDAPGRAVAESTAGHEPYQVKSGPFPHPHIIRHLLFFSDRSERSEARAIKKAQTHAMISYDENGNAPVDELPAAMVFGKKR